VIQRSAQTRARNRVSRIDIVQWDQAACPVAADGAGVEGQHAQVDAVEPGRAERLARDQRDRLTAPAAPRGVIGSGAEPDAGGGVQGVRPHRARQRAGGPDDRGMGGLVTETGGWRRGGSSARPRWRCRCGRWQERRLAPAGPRTRPRPGARRRTAGRCGVPTGDPGHSTKRLPDASRRRAAGSGTGLGTGTVATPLRRDPDSPLKERFCLGVVARRAARHVRRPVPLRRHS
jgi:hypothetical protein